MHHMSATPTSRFVAHLLQVVVLWMLSAGVAQAANALEERTVGIGTGNNWSRSWVDVNGDGRTDYCYLYDTDGQSIRCHYASSEGKYSTTPDIERFIERTSDGLMWWADVDGDGRPDLCRADAGVQAGESPYTFASSAVW